MLAEFAKDALDAKEDTDASKLTGLGDFLSRLESGESAEAMRENARERLLTRHETAPAPVADQIAVAQSFLATL